MSGSIVSFGGSSSITITELLTALQSVRRGYDETSLTNYSTQALPAIAAGSCCEIGGALYKFSTEEPISTTNVTSTSNCTYFVELVASSSTVSARFSTVTPVWREDYNGWYESTALVYRTIAEMEKYGSSQYWYKNEFKYLDRNRIKHMTSTGTSVASTFTFTVSHYIVNAYTNSRILDVRVGHISTMQVSTAYYIWNDFVIGDGISTQYNYGAYVGTIVHDTNMLCVLRSLSTYVFNYNIFTTYI